MIRKWNILKLFSFPPKINKVLNKQNETKTHYVFFLGILSECKTEVGEQCMFGGFVMPLTENCN